MHEVPELEDFTDDFNPFTALLETGGESAIEDPYPELARLRAISPVQQADLHEMMGLRRHGTVGDRLVYSLLGHKEVDYALLTPADFSNRVYETNLGITFGRSVTVMDGGEHMRYRRLFQAAFIPKMLDNLRLRFQAVIDRLMARFIRRGRADLVKEFALHFPFQFIMDLMDIPAEGRSRFHKITMAQMCVMVDRDHAVQASRMLGAYLDALINARRDLKSDSDFVSVIANAEAGGERLPQEVVISFFRQLTNAGGDTSYHGFSNVLAGLLTHPDQFEALRRDRSLIPQAIEECLRWNGPLAGIQRETVRELTFGDVTIPQGTYVHLVIGAANRDESVWPDPHRLDIFRDQKRHVAFGYGPHVCIGQHLARMELTMALHSLLDRLPDLRLDPDYAAPVIRGLTMRGAESVHVRFD